MTTISANAGLEEGLAAYDKGDYRKAFTAFNDLAERGDASARYRLARMYRNGLGVLKNTQKANETAESAVRGKAFESFRRDALAGKHDGQFFLGEMLRLGDGVAKDEVDANIWFKRAADQGNADAQNALGASYLAGRGINKDLDAAGAWFLKAANQGLILGQNNLAAYYHQLGGLVSDEEAVKWWRLAADREYPDAQANLAWANRSGRGIKKNDVEAAFWFRKAAEQGHAGAQGGLGTLYALGQGVPKDEHDAYFWFYLAQAGGRADAAAAIDKLTAQLPESTRAAIELAAKEWQPRLTESPRIGRLSLPPTVATVKAIEPDSTGSGWYVSKSRVITNAHVVFGCVSIKLGGNVLATLGAIDRQSDLAVLEVPTANVSATIRSGRIRQGDAVTVVGYPLRGVLASGTNVTAGHVSALAGIQNDSRFIQISAPVQPGNSGGPLLDASGNVIGVVVSKLNAVKIAQVTGDIPQNVNFAVSPATLQGFLEANNIDFKSAPSNKNLATADVASIAKKFTVVVECYK
jgi:uncharacterized protein